MTFVVIAVGIILFGVLSAFTFGGAIVGIVLVLIGVLALGVSLVFGTAREGGAEPTLSRVERTKPELLGPGGPDDPERGARRPS